MLLAKQLHANIQQIVRETANQERFQLVDDNVDYFIGAEVDRKLMERNYRRLNLTGFLLAVSVLLIALWMCDAPEPLDLASSIERTVHFRPKHQSLRLAGIQGSPTAIEEHVDAVVLLKLSAETLLKMMITVSLSGGEELVSTTP